MPSCDLAIRRDTIAGTDEHGLPHGKTCRRDFARGAVDLQKRCLRNEIGKRANPVARLPCGNTFQNFTHSEEEIQPKPLLPPRLMNNAPMAAIVIRLSMVKGCPTRKADKRAAGNGSNSDQAGGDECPIADLWHDQFHTPGWQREAGR